MKAGLLAIAYIKHSAVKDNIRRRKKNPPYGKFEEKINVPYINDNDIHHQFDVIYAPKEIKKNCCIIDIHGGSYIFGEHQDNYHFACKFVEKGFDCITIDYRLNNGKIDTKDQVDDCALCLNYIFSHLKELNLENDCFAIMGDSAGGHLAFILAQAILNKDVADTLGYTFPKIKLVATLLNCPVYDFENIAKGTLTKGGAKRLFGPNHANLEKMRLISPRTYIDSFKGPLFLSSCKKDFIGYHSQLLNEDMKKKDNMYHFEYLDTDEKYVGHVHNVIHIDHYLGIQVNNRMMSFIEEAMKESQ